jgi:energy-converting hydrogenase Eha subunit G
MAQHASVRALATRRKQMNKELQAMIDGIAIGLGFVGVLGFAVNPAVWPILLSLIGTAIVLVIGTRLKESNE